MPRRNPQTREGELSRREVLLSAGAVATALGVAGLERLLLGGSSRNPNQGRQQLWQDLSATATAGVGQEVVGDAAEHFSPESVKPWAW